VVGESRGHLGEDARTIGDVEADVVAGEGLAHVEQRQVGIGALPRPAATEDPVPSDSDVIAEDGAGRRLATGTAPVEHQLAGRLGFDEDGVESLTHAGERVPPRNHRRVDSHGNPCRRAVFAIGALADREQLDDAVHVLGGLDVGRGDLGDALAVDVLAGDPSVEGEAGEDRRLGRRVEALDIGRRVGLGITERLGLAHRVGEALPGRVHLVEHVVGRAVDDPHDLAHGVAGEGFAQRPQQRYAARHRRLEVEVDAMLGGGGIQGRAVLGEESLVGRDDRGTVRHGAQDEGAGGLDAADDLDDDVGAGDEIGGVGGEEGRVQCAPAGGRRCRRVPEGDPPGRPDRRRAR